MTRQTARAIEDDPVMEAMEQKIDRLQAQNRDLLAALERYLSPNVACHCDRTTHPSGKCAGCQARAAIAAAKGEPSR